MSSHRVEKLQSVLLRELRRMFLFEWDNPALTQISLTRVALTKDLGIARVYYEKAVGTEDHPEMQSRLTKLAPRVRQELAKRVRLKAVPKVEFFYDKINQAVSKVERLIESL